MISRMTEDDISHLVNGNLANLGEGKIEIWRHGGDPPIAALKFLKLNGILGRPSDFNSIDETDDEKLVEAYLEFWGLYLADMSYIPSSKRSEWDIPSHAAFSGILFAEERSDYYRK